MPVGKKTSHLHDGLCIGQIGHLDLFAWLPILDIPAKV